jgi:hypothetical protein
MRRRVSWLLVPLAWALACGSRFEQTIPGSDGDAGSTSTGQGGSSQSRAGAPSRGGTGQTGKAGTSGRGGTGQTGKAGAPASGGAFGTAGTFGTGGAFPIAGTFSMGGSCACDGMGCGPGYLPVPNANGCCYHCELDLKSCEVQHQNYLAFRQQLVDKYQSIGCNVSSDCSIYYEKNVCGVACGIPIANSVLKDLDANLSSYAQMACNAACPPAPQPPCPPASPPECWKSYCQ